MEAGAYIPPATHTLPAALTEFENTEAKTAYVGQVLDVVTKSCTLADNQYNTFLFKEAYSEYVVACEGLMALIKVTLDDANFQTFLKQRIGYVMQRVSVYFCY